MEEGGHRGRAGTWIAYKGNAFQHTDGSDDEGEVGWNLEGEVESDLCQVSCKVPAGQPTMTNTSAAISHRPYTLTACETVDCHFCSRRCMQTV